MQTTLEIRPQAPFDFAKSLRFIRDFPATKQEQVVEANQLIKGIRIGGMTTVIDMIATGTMDHPCLSMTIHSDVGLTEKQIQQIEKRIRFMLSLDDDLTPFFALVKQDAPFQNTVMPQLTGYHHVKFPTPFENAVWAIISQRQSISQSRQMKQALVDRYSLPITYQDRAYEAFPQPDDFMPLDLTALTDLIGNERKARYIGEVILAFSDVDEDFLLKSPYDEIKQWLMSIKGIGEWSATFVLTRGLGRMELALITDPESKFSQSMRRAAKPIYGNISFNELSNIAMQYGVWQGYWAHFMKAYSNFTSPNKSGY